MAASEASARIRQELVRWRNEFRAAKGRDPAKDEVPEEHKKMLRQLRDSTNLPRTSGPRGGGGGGGDRGEDSDSHVSGSPVRRDRVLDTIPRRSAGKLPGAQALAAKPKRRRARVLPMSDDDEAEGPAVPEPTPSTPGPSDSKSLTLGSLFTQVVDILEDVPRSGPPRKKQRQSPDDPNNPRPLASYTRRKKPKQNIYRKRFKGSGGYSKGKAKKITTSNFCQVSRGGRQPPRGGGGRGKTGRRSGGAREEFRPFDALLDGDVDPTAPATPQGGVGLEDGREASAGGASATTTLEPPSAEMRDALARGQETDEVRELMTRVFGFCSFREGQLGIIGRILRGESTLAVMPTGHGKSLLYQVPALVLESPAPILVVSPLLALMRDQVSKLPDCIPKGMLSSGQTAAEALSTLDRIRSNAIKVLFVSPERLQSRSFLQAYKSLGHPPPFVCIDEAHCISEWGHSFRPAYFRMGRVLREDLGVGCVLALTATATTKSIGSIRDILNLEEDAVVRATPVRKNLRLAVSRLAPGEDFKDAVLGLFRPNGRLESAKAAIVYCNFQLQAELVAAHLYTNGVTAKSYHAKMTTQERDRVQDLFCRGRCRVVCATVAFGMGLDKSDVDAVVHSEIPRSVEEYVQQVGRAGRDGREAQCHLFHSSGGYRRLRSLCHSEGLDESMVHSLLVAIFWGRVVPESTGTAATGILPLQETSLRLDVRESTIEAVLTFLEGEGGCGGLVRMLQPLVGHVCDFVFFNASDDAAKRHPLLGHIKAVSKGQSLRGGHYTVEIGKLAEESGMSVAEIQESVRALQRERVAECRVKDRALCYEIRSDPENKRSLAQRLCERLSGIEQEGLGRLESLRDMVERAEEAGSAEEAEAVIKSGIRDYFEGEGPQSAQRRGADAPNPKFISRDARVFIQGNRHLLRRQKGSPMLTGRAIARIMQGISSPAYPATTWGRNTLWGRYMDTDFEVLLKAANRELVWYVNNKL